jgi:hypothetical protein
MALFTEHGQEVEAVDRLDHREPGLPDAAFGGPAFAVQVSALPLKFLGFIV